MVGELADAIRGYAAGEPSARENLSKSTFLVESCAILARCALQSLGAVEGWHEGANKRRAGAPGAGSLCG